MIIIFLSPSSSQVALILRFPTPEASLAWFGRKQIFKVFLAVYFYLLKSFTVLSRCPSYRPICPFEQASPSRPEQHQ